MSLPGHDRFSDQSGVRGAAGRLDQHRADLLGRAAGNQQQHRGSAGNRQLSGTEDLLSGGE